MRQRAMNAMFVHLTVFSTLEGAIPDKLSIFYNVQERSHFESEVITIKLLSEHLALVQGHVDVMSCFQ